MSEEPSHPPAVDLSGLQFMPSWVASLGKEKPSWEEHPAAQREERREGGGRGAARGFRDDRGAPPRRDDRRRDAGPGGAPARQDDRGGVRGFGGRGREDGWRDRPAPAALPEGITASVEPEERALEALVAHVRATKHAFSIFDAAKLVLADGGRFRVRLSVEEGAPGLWRVPADGSVWRTRAEAENHVLAGSVLEKYYRAEEVEREAPRGVFQSVAVCGFSGEILGPPNHHSYPSAVARVHRERFGNLPLEAYRRRIRVEHGPEMVEKWLATQRKAIEWVWLKDPTVPKPVAAAPAAAAEAPEASVAEPSESAGLADAVPEATVPEAEAPAVQSPEESVAPEATESGTGPTAGEGAPACGLVLKTRAEMEAHFRAHHANRAVKEVRHAVLPGLLDNQVLNHDLTRLARVTIDMARSKPFVFAQKLCGSFERKGLKIFKRRGGKLFVSCARPKALDPSVPLSDGVRRIIDAVKAKPGLTVRDLLGMVAPHAPAAEEGENPAITPERRQAMLDLHWLADAGFLIEFSDGVVTMGVQGDTPRHQPKAKAPPEGGAAPAGENPAPEAGPTEPEEAGEKAEDAEEAQAEPEAAATDPSDLPDPDASRPEPSAGGADS